MDADVDQLFCLLDGPTAAGIPLEHKITYRPERRILRDPRSRDSAFARWHLHFQKRKVEAEGGISGYSFARRSRRALAMTDTELKLIAAAAKTGCNSNPVNGYSTPAAIGTPSRL
jgi:hypothetical protein